MTIVGSKRMIVYDDVAQQEKIRIFDARVDRPPHYDTFAEFHYAYHYGDTYAPYVKQEEPLKTECQHFLDCIQHGRQPLTHGGQGLELVKILEASSESLRLGGGPVELRDEKEPSNLIPRIVPVRPHNGKRKGDKVHLPVFVAPAPLVAA
jgi:predicted dehydrogenase